MGRFILIFSFQLISIGFLVAQKTTCPCHDCPKAIADGEDGFEGIANGTFESVQTVHANIFNVLNNDLSSNSQCVKSVQVTFKHDYVGDLTMFLFSPSGDSVQLIGPWVTGSFVSTSNTTFEVTFLPSSDIVNPEDGFGKYWDNDQDWATFGRRRGTYYPHNGELEDFNRGAINGSWSLRVHDSQPEGNDIGEILDFSVEFCDPAGLVCDPCEEENEMGIPCVFQLEGSREQITPIESVCVDVLAQNVAFLEQLRWSMEWDQTVVNNAFIQNTNQNIPDFSVSNFTIDNNAGTIDLFYQIPPTDTLGAVVADSSVLFQVCFTGAGEEGDSTFLSFTDLQVFDIEGIAPMTDTKEGVVVLTVDLSADCKTAKQLCGKDPIQVETTKGPGFEKNEGGDCWSEDAETQSKWYQFDILQSGTLEFMIQPLAAAGFRYILFKDGCEGEAIACLPAGDNESRAIGLSDDGMAAFGVEGKFGPSITVEQGQSYFLVVDNKGNNSVGCLLYTSPSPRDATLSRMPSSA